jgi:negative regulator of flagellin synthesis FlgM
MRIDAYTQVTQLYNNTKVKSAAKPARAGFSDAVQISSFGKDYQVAKKALASATDVRAELVDPIKTAVQGGTYDVSDSDFADKLLEKYSSILG